MRRSRPSVTLAWISTSTRPAASTSTAVRNSGTPAAMDRPNRFFVSINRCPSIFCCTGVHEDFSACKAWICRQALSEMAWPKANGACSATANMKIPAHNETRFPFIKSLLEKSPFQAIVRNLLMWKIFALRFGRSKPILEM